MIEAEARCRRCGARVPKEAEQFAHLLPVQSTCEASAVVLVMCRPCGSGFPTVRDRDEYARLVYFG
jgi:hypothetical protein